MTIEIRVPQLPESVADALLVTWHKQPGDTVARDENLADLETDKVVLEVPAPNNGVIKELKVEPGTTVTSGQLLAVIEPGAAPAKAAAKPADAAAAPTSASKSAAKPGADDAGKLSPSVRRLVEENKLDPANIPASGKDGRITKGDVMGFLDGKASQPAASSASGAVVAGARSEQRVPMTRLRQRIAERLVEAQSTQALLTTFNEVDLHEVMALRSRYKEQFEKTHGVKLGFMSFFIKAAIEALKKFPLVNASIDGSDIVYHEYYDIGVAVSTDRGLMVPVVRDADLKSVADLEQEIGAYAGRARDGKISIEELT
ncbi:MAG TPA: dihydrolipoyllysine-residue succinyltransferase, partial [Steroidobacteraceae bacterium]|nr:dihydrolipoyllysine-residue succinyltransferase [Steroidobacteraceae bacterium]